MVVDVVNECAFKRRIKTVLLSLSLIIGAVIFVLMLYNTINMMVAMPVTFAYVALSKQGWQSV